MQIVAFVACGDQETAHIDGAKVVDVTFLSLAPWFLVGTGFVYARVGAVEDHREDLFAELFEDSRFANFAFGRGLGVFEAVVEQSGNCLVYVAAVFEDQA